MKATRRKKLMTMAALLGMSCTPVSAFAETSDEMKMILELKRIIQQQQEQLTRQAAQIENMQLQMENNVAAMEQQPEGQQGSAAATPEETSMVVTSAVKNVDLSVYGQVNRAVLFADNGDTSETYFVDNTNSSTRFGLDANVDVNPDFNVGSKIEYEFLSSPSDTVNQLNTSVNKDLAVRHAELFFTSSALGKVSLGRGSMAADGTSGIDLSGTGVIAGAAVTDMAGSQLWYDGSQLTELQISDVFSDLGGGREDRIRYDTPTVAGFTASTSAAADDMYDFTLRYNRQYSGATVASALAWQSPGDDVDNIYNGSISVLLNNGLSFQLSGGTEDRDQASEGSFWYTKIGYMADIWNFGKTSFSLDYGSYDDFLMDDGQAETFALAIVQDIPAWGTEMYLAFRQYMYEERTTDYDDINTLMGGARVKF